MAASQMQLTLSLVCLALLIPLAAAQWNDEEAQQDCTNKNECGASFPVISQGGTTCECADIEPVYYAGGPRAATCLEVVQQNRCHDPTLQQVSSSEIAEGYCSNSCGNCTCCDTFAQALQKSGLSTFLQAANAVGLKGNLSSPAYSFTILAPTDAAFTAFLASKGLTAAQLMANVPLLRRIVTFHILPNVPVLNAFWTTPFLLPGTILSTLLGKTANIKVTAGPTFNALARATTNDIAVCKGNIIGINAVLLQPANVVARSPPLWDPTPAATAAANYTILPTPESVLARTAAAPQERLPGEPKLTVPGVESFAAPLAPVTQNSDAVDAPLP